MKEEWVWRGNCRIKNPLIKSVKQVNIKSGSVSKDIVRLVGVRQLEIPYK